MSFRSNTMSEEGPARFAWLFKDKKVICRTKHINFPFEVSDCWSIEEYKPSSKYRELNLPQFKLYPAPANSREEIEWTNFMTYLSTRDKVAILKMESCSFYLFAPNEWQKFTHANVSYKIEKETRVVEMSGESPMKAKNSSKDGKLGECPTKAKNLSKDDKLGGSPTKAKNSSNDSKLSSYKAGIDYATDDGSLNSSGLESGPERSARIHPSYLKTLSQTHAWAFGALAELIDNSRDASAPRLAISVEHLYSRKLGERIPVLSVVDDGIGMSHSDIVRMLTFGHTSDNENQDRIGCFGVGFKTGTMKLGKDVLVLTQSTGSRSVGFLSQSYNEHKENLEIPIITYRKIGSFMEIDTDIQSEDYANRNLDAIKEFSPFNEYLLGERLGLFGEEGTGTQIYIWNLEKWGSNYSLEWVDYKTDVEDSLQCGDILIRSRRLRARAGQISKEVPLDYSLQAYLEVIFLDPRMKIIIQGSMVKSRPLAKSLNKTSTLKGTINGKEIILTLGRSRVEWERMNGGIFLYWHGRLIEAYKRVGGMIHKADIGRGVIGVVEVSDLMDDERGHVMVLNSKQGFQDCEVYAKLEEWLGSKLDEYWDKYFDRVELDKGIKTHEPDHEWVQCDKCRKWRILDASFNSDSLPSEWFCYMPPFNGSCETPEQQMVSGTVTVGIKRSSAITESAETKEKLSPIQAKKIHGERNKLVRVARISPKDGIISSMKKRRVNNSNSKSSAVHRLACENESSGDSSSDSE